jgi:hypothetical protein
LIRGLVMTVVAVYDIKGVCEINAHPGCLWAGVQLRDRYNELTSEKTIMRIGAFTIGNIVHTW